MGTGREEGIGMRVTPGFWVCMTEGWRMQEERVCREEDVPGPGAVMPMKLGGEHSAP